MDIHRARFVPYPTSAITALAFSRADDGDRTTASVPLRLAVGRANGNIEIWNPQNGAWLQEAVFLGDDKSIDGLAWTQDPDDTDAEGNAIPGQHRLFSIASSAHVTEWDLGTGEPKRRSTGNFSEVWCFAAQPRKRQEGKSGVDGDAQDIVAGCGDGTIVLLSTADGDLQFKRFLARVGGKRARCMCVAYQNRDKVVAGFADSTIRVYDTRKGAMVRSMSLGVSLAGAQKHALVWQVKSLPTGDIVSADSNGEVRIWDGKMYSLVQRITGHATDCLDLVTSYDGNTIFSGSIDGKMAIYRQTRDPSSGKKTWAKASHRRTHQGEVKSMAAFDGKDLSVVVSGGGDVSPVVTPFRTYGKENLRTLQGLPQEPPLTGASAGRLIVSWWDRCIYIWRIAKEYNTDEELELQRPRKLVAQLNLDSKQHIRSVSISPDGKILAASTSTDVKVFQLKQLKVSDPDSLSVHKLRTPPEFSDVGARLLNISPDGKWIAKVTPDSEVHVARVDHETSSSRFVEIISKTVELERQRRKSFGPSAFRRYDRAINRLAFASDSSVLVVSDFAGFLDSWVLQGREDLLAARVDVTKHSASNASSDSSSDSDSDSDDEDDTTTIFYGQHWADNPSGHLLPRLDSTPLILTFRSAPPSSAEETNGNPAVHPTRHNPHAHAHTIPGGDHRLFVLSARHQIYEFDILLGRLSGWSRAHPSASLPEDFLKLRDRAMGAVWDFNAPTHRERLWLYGSSFLCMLDVGEGPFTTPGESAEKPAAKRRRSSHVERADGEFWKRRRLESGAGGKLEALHKEGMQSGARRYENGRWSDVELDGVARAAIANGDEDGDDEVLSFGLKGAEGNESALEVPRRKWYLTLKYRPILGVVPLDDRGARGRETDDRPLEVAIVERPLLQEGGTGKP